MPAQHSCRQDLRESASAQVGLSIQHRCPHSAHAGRSVLSGPTSLKPHHTTRAGPPKPESRRFESVARVRAMSGFARGGLVRRRTRGHSAVSVARTNWRARRPSWATRAGPAPIACSATPATTGSRAALARTSSRAATATTALTAGRGATSTRAAMATTPSTRPMPTRSGSTAGRAAIRCAPT